MFDYLPRKWSRRMVVVYTAASVIGLVVLTLLLGLLGVLRWMSAFAPLPDARQLVHSKATGYVVIRVGGASSQARETLTALARLASRQTPQQVTRLLEKGADDKDCPFQAVISAWGEDQEAASTAAISLGRYPGRFRLVQRDIAQRARDRLLPLTVTFHKGRTVFARNGLGDAVPSFCLTDCSLISATHASAAIELLDALDAPARIQQPWSPPTGDAAFWGWAAGWRKLPLAQTLTGQAAKRIEGLLGEMDVRFPPAAAAREVRFEGAWQGPRSAELRIFFSPASGEDPGQIAAAMAQWLGTSGRPAGITAARGEAQGSTAILVIQATIQE